LYGEAILKKRKRDPLGPVDTRSPSLVWIVWLKEVDRGANQILTVATGVVILWEEEGWLKSGCLVGAHAPHVQRPPQLR
jgi:hypothetical protein